MYEPKGSRVLGAMLLVVIIAVVFFGLWTFVSMAFVGGTPSNPALFAIGAIVLGAVAIATTMWLVRLVGSRNADSALTAPPPPVDGEHTSA